LAQHPKDKNCPTDFIFSKKAGRCVNQDLEKAECPDCFENFKDLYEEYLENS